MGDRLVNGQRTRVKICGVRGVEDALMVAAAGADAVGLVFYAPSPRHVEIEQAAAIVRALPPFVTAVGLFVDAGPQQVRDIHAAVGFGLAQYHGDETPEQCTAAGLPFLKVFRVRPGLDLLHCTKPFAAASGFLLDAFQPGVPGGTGHRFDWSLIPKGLERPLVLSGGLDADNVGEAVRSVRPFAVDVSSGVEVSKGVKGVDRVRAFIEEVRHADV